MNANDSGVVQRRLQRRTLLALTVPALALACGSTTPPPKAKEAPRAPALHRGPLTDYVSAAGLRWMVVGSPERIATSPAFSDALSLLFPPERLTLFARDTGVELRQVRAALVAGFDLGNLYLFESPEAAKDRIVERFRERLGSSESLDRPHPELLRVSGLVGERPQTLVHVAPTLFAIATDDPTLARVVEAFARNKLSRSPPALRGAALSALAGPPANASATFYAPGPFVGEWQEGVGGLLADAVALSISLVPVGNRKGRFTLELAGDFPSRAPDALVAALQDLSASSTGKLLGLDQPTLPPAVHEREGRLMLEVELDLGPIARGLRAAVISDIWEIMGLPPPSSG